MHTILLIDDRAVSILMLKVFGTPAPVKECSAFQIKRCTTMLLSQSVIKMVYISICVKIIKMTIASKAVRTVQSTLC